MKQCLAAYTSSAMIYPDYINVYCNDSGEYEITIREKANLDGSFAQEGKTVMITLSSEAMMAFLDDLNARF